MNLLRKTLKIALPFLLGLFLVIFFAFGSEENDPKQERLRENKKLNENCFQCHGQRKYTFQNTENQKTIAKRMCPDKVIPRDQFYISNHKTFKCIDCHSEDYDTFPHPGRLRMEDKYACLDCHGGDETYAKFNFEEIETEFQKSVHATKHSEDFSCWMCHSPHTYKINARTNENVKETVSYDNSICLSCHSNIDKYQLLTDKSNPNIIQKHDWLPNQQNHFQNVRCIECHAAMDKNILIAHNVQPKTKAVKRCVECHSENSILLSKLYRFQTKESRKKYGLFSATFLDNSYIIGTRKNTMMNNLSFLFLVITILVIAIHITLRLTTKK